MLYICNVKPPGHGQDGSGDTNKSAPRPLQGRREIRRGGPYKPSRGAPAKAPRRGGPLASPRTSRYTARARQEHGRFPGQAALRKPPGTHRRTRPAPKMHPEHHPHAPFGKGLHKSRQKENIDIVGNRHHPHHTVSPCAVVASLDKGHKRYGKSLIIRYMHIYNIIIKNLKYLGTTIDKK